MVEDLRELIERGPGWVSVVHGGVAASPVDMVDARVNWVKKYLASSKVKTGYGSVSLGFSTKIVAATGVGISLAVGYMRAPRFGGGRVKDPVEAVAQLDAIEADAAEMGYEVPKQAVVNVARRILEQMCSYVELPFDAYSMSGGRVAIGVDGGVGRSMIVICEPEGSALCVVTVGSRSRRARYDDASFLADDFVRQGLRDMVVVKEGVAASEL